MKISHTTLAILGAITICLLFSKCKKENTVDVRAPVTNEAFTGENGAVKLASKSLVLDLNPVTTKSVPLSLNGVSNRVISQLQIAGGSATCIALANCSNITIQNCILYGSSSMGISLYKCTNVNIINCFIFNVSSGVYASVSSTVSVNNNQFLNMQGPDPGGNFVQFDNVSGSGNTVNNNICENVAGQSNPYDEISMYMSNGTADSPIQISGNWLKGGGPNTISAGIQLGDKGGSYQVAENNVIVDPGQVGIAVSSGHNIDVINNTIYAKSQPFTNVGICVWNEYKSKCAIITVTGNKVKWKNAKNEVNNKWNGGGCGKISGWSENDWNAKIDAAVLPSTMITKLFPK